MTKKDSIGGMRKVKTTFMGFEERISKYTPPNLCEYGIIFPTEKEFYRSRIELIEEGSGCRINWTITHYQKRNGKENLRHFSQKSFKTIEIPNRKSHISRVKVT